MTHYENGKYKNERITIPRIKKGEGEPTRLIDSTFTKCVFDVSATQNMWDAHHSTFIDCTFNLKLQRSFFGCRNNYIRCKFTGLIDSGGFGNDNVDTPEYDGSFVDCDLTELTVWVCNFHEDKPGKLSIKRELLPRWPHATFFIKEVDRSLLKKYPWPKEAAQSFYGIDGVLEGMNFVEDRIWTSFVAHTTYWAKLAKDGKELEKIKTGLIKCGAFINE